MCFPLLEQEGRRKGEGAAVPYIFGRTGGREREGGGGVKKRPVHISEAGTSEGNGAGGRGEGISGHTRWVKSCAT